ncbi:MAG: 4Fe-4S dicluster domain-containing protein [Rhodospirillales bacterium]|nr:4Fe-4S dicluster domain-containing protein [Rhodospirillales bacterium]MCW8863100.1 4Fe-4S dicluster domain-containing protein [Rhodospirillales bacterium]MCW8971398.1 4Fe-4S dicluster domain-containing protein [Rhodospirillales bacterium]
MTAATSPESTRKYDLGFYRYVRDNVDGGDRLNKCMQCGVCSGSCPLRTDMDHGPRKIFMMVRAGMKQEVLKSNTLTNCVSCYNCVVRCPRQVPVKYLLQGLLGLAVKEGYQEQTTSENGRFAKAFWWTASKYGRTDERLMSMKFFFAMGVGEGIKRSLANQKLAMKMLKAGRMHLGMPHKIKNTGELQKILAKAQEIDGRA